jgi:hypothetical protein
MLAVFAPRPGEVTALGKRKHEHSLDPEEVIPIHRQLMV